MEERPLVSVIIPAYNAAKLVRETIDSILAQTYSPIEIVVVDDGSKDATGEILKPLADAGKIHYIRQENQGQAAARKNGFAVSKGRYVSFIDADDLIAPEKIKTQVEYLEIHPSCGVVYSDIYHFWHHAPDILLRKKLTYHSGQIFNELIREGNLIQVMTALIRRDVLEKYGMPDATFRRSDDWYLWLNLAHHGVEFFFMDRVFAFQRRQKEGTLSDQKTYFKETAETNIAVYERYKKILSPEEVKKHNLDGLINFWRYRLAIGYVIMGDKAKAREALAAYRASSAKERVKKIFLFGLLTFVPVSILARAIFEMREFKKRHSFEPVADKNVVLPKTRKPL